MREIQICWCYSREYFLFKVAGSVSDKGFPPVAYLFHRKIHQTFICFFLTKWSSKMAKKLYFSKPLYAKTVLYVSMISRITLKKLGLLRLSLEASNCHEKYNWVGIFFSLEHYANFKRIWKPGLQTYSYRKSEKICLYEIHNITKIILREKMEMIFSTSGWYPHFDVEDLDLLLFITNSTVFKGQFTRFLPPNFFSIN